VAAWLGTVKPLREGIVRALTVREARPVAAPLLIAQMRRYRGDGASSTAWAIGNALATVADDSVYDDVKSLALDPELGRSREMLAEALQRMKTPDATRTLIRMLEDRDVAGHAVSALSKRDDPTGSEALRPFLHDKRTWVRKAARRALDRPEQSE
jgi:HEAT repeat protein